MSSITADRSLTAIKTKYKSVDECVEGISKVLDSRQANINKIMDMHPIINSALSIEEDYRFGVMAQTYESTLFADKLRTVNVNNAVKVMRQAVSDIKSKNPYRLQYQFTAYYTYGTQPMEEVKSDKYYVDISSQDKIIADANAWLRGGIRRKREYKKNGSVVKLDFAGATVTVDTVDSNNKLVYSMGESARRHRF